MHVWTITFPSGHRARAVRLMRAEPPRRVLKALALPPARGVLLLHGGAARLPQALEPQLRDLFLRGLAPFLAHTGFTVLDGGTQTGVMALLGETCARLGIPNPRVGVCPAALVTWPQGPQGHERVPLEPHHTHFVLTPGETWGSETPHLFGLAQELSVGAPALALLVDGGEGTLREVLYNVRQGRPLLVVRGSGRLADALWRAHQEQRSTHLPPEAYTYEGLHWVDLSQGPEALYQALYRLLPQSP